MSDMVNEVYRKARGTDKPFTTTEEQAKALWNEQIRKEKPPYFKRPNPTHRESPRQ